MGNFHAIILLQSYNFVLHNRLWTILHSTPCTLATLPGEYRLLGRGDINQPLVAHINAIHSHSATRIAWHAHGQFELICVLNDATTYESQDGHNVERAGGQFLNFKRHGHRIDREVSLLAHKEERVERG